MWIGLGDIPAFRSMRTLRALRPLRAVSRWEGMRVSKRNWAMPQNNKKYNQFSIHSCIENYNIFNRRALRLRHYILYFYWFHFIFYTFYFILINVLFLLIISVLLHSIT